MKWYTFFPGGGCVKTTIENGNAQRRLNCFDIGSIRQVGVLVKTVILTKQSDCVHLQTQNHNRLSESSRYEK